MENRILKFPLYAKLIPSFFIILGIYFLIYFIDISILNIVFIIMFIILLYFSLVKYTFKNNKILIKYPFLYSKEIQNININGFMYEYSGFEKKLILFLDKNNKIKIEIIGKKMKEYIEYFINEIYSDIVNKNIEEIKKYGIEYNFKKNKKIIFFCEYIEINDNLCINRYYYEKDIKNISYQNYNGMLLINIYFKNNLSLNLNDYLLKGKKGLCKYIEDKIK